MRKMLIAAMLCMVAGAASAQTPTPLPTPMPAPTPLPTPMPRPPGPFTAACSDLAIVSWNGTRSPPGAPLATNEVAIHFQVRNNGPLTYRAPDENKQWISLVLEMPTGATAIGVNVLPPSGSGPVTLARGAEWRGHVRATLPAGVTRTSHPPARLQLNFAPASAGWTPPRDCSTANNRINVVLR